MSLCGCAQFCKRVTSFESKHIGMMVTNLSDQKKFTLKLFTLFQVLEELLVYA